MGSIEFSVLDHQLVVARLPLKTWTASSPNMVLLSGAYSQSHGKESNPGPLGPKRGRLTSTPLSWDSIVLMYE